MRINILSPEDWAQLSESAHRACFSQKRSAGTDRIDYAMVAEKDEAPIGYITVHDIDSETCYWQFGGALPPIAGTSLVYRAYSEAVDWAKRAGYKNIFTLIEAQNTAMLKLAMKVGFRIVGTRNHDGSVLVEHRLVLGGK